LRVAQRILASGIDGFVTTDRLLVNGVAVDPAPGASIVVFTQVNKIVSSNAAMTVVASRCRTSGISASTPGP
jgi:hypothetical protein